jgi:hypothetical protein
MRVKFASVIIRDDEVPVDSVDFVERRSNSEAAP